MELVDMMDSKSIARKGVGVRVPPSVLSFLLTLFNLTKRESFIMAIHKTFKKECTNIKQAF